MATTTMALGVAVARHGAHRARDWARISRGYVGMACEWLRASGGAHGGGSASFGDAQDQHVFRNDLRPMYFVTSMLVCRNFLTLLINAKPNNHSVADQNVTNGVSLVVSSAGCQYFLM